MVAAAVVQNITGSFAPVQILAEEVAFKEELQMAKFAATTVAVTTITTEVARHDTIGVPFLQQI